MSLLYVDACCDLSKIRIKTMGVEVVELPFTLDSQKNITNHENDFDYIGLYGEVKNGKKLNAKSLEVEDYKNNFIPALQQGENILYLHYSGKLGKSVKNMEEVISFLKKEFPKRKIITFDTKALSVQAGLICYEGAIMHKRCDSDKDIIEELEQLKYQTAFYFMSDGFDKVICKNVSEKISGSALIKPIYAVDDNGEIINIGKAQGKKKGIIELFEKVKALGENLADYPIAIVHAGCEKDAIELKNKIAELIGSDARIWIESASPTTLSHMGVGSIGVAFHSKKRI